jgi:NADPH:quinone reductase-like Zn-dependent oxidoreductase
MLSQLAPHDTLRKTQRALILRGLKQRYELVDDWPVPLIENPNEVLIRIEAIGLNPIDWKSVDFGFAIPTLPAVNGREFSGVVVDVGPAVKHLKKGDKVFGPSTQYRDYRTSAFQSYAITLDHCLGVIPQTLTFEQASAIGLCPILLDNYSILRSLFQAWEL